MSDDAFPSVEDLDDAPPRRSAKKSARKPAKRAKRAARKKTSKRTAKEEKVLREAGFDIEDGEDVEAPPKRSGPKSGIEKTADKIINDLFKKNGVAGVSNPNWKWRDGVTKVSFFVTDEYNNCLLYTSPSPRD